METLSEKGKGPEESLSEDWLEKGVIRLFETSLERQKGKGKEIPLSFNQKGKPGSDLPGYFRDGSTGRLARAGGGERKKKRVTAALLLKRKNIGAVAFFFCARREHWMGTHGVLGRERDNHFFQESSERHARRLALLVINKKKTLMLNGGGGVGKG